MMIAYRKKKFDIFTKGPQNEQNTTVICLHFAYNVY